MAERFVVKQLGPGAYIVKDRATSPPIVAARRPNQRLAERVARRLNTKERRRA